MLRIGKVTKISLLISAIFFIFLVTPVSAQSPVTWKLDPNGGGCLVTEPAGTKVWGNNTWAKDPNPNSNALLICCLEPGGYSFWQSVTASPSCSQVLADKKKFTNIPVGTVNPGPLALVAKPVYNEPKDICKSDAGNDTSQTYKDCMNCIDKSIKPGNLGNVWSASGCFKGTEAGIANSLLRIIYGIALVFILIRIIIAGYLIQFGSNPDQIKENKQAIINAIIALIVGTGGIVITRYIGYDILGLGNFLPGLPSI
jgi:preprotein translocase subunit SecG